MQGVCKQCGKRIRIRDTGLCVTCYTVNRPKRNRLITCKKCGKIKPHWSSSMCHTCCGSIWKYKNRERKPRSILSICKECQKKQMVGRISGLCFKCLKRVSKRRYQLNRCKTDVEYNLLTKLRTQIYKALTGVYKQPHIHTIELLGCTIKEFRTHLETRFVPGISWDNYGRGGWHCDHIVPVDMFNLNDPAQLKQCFHYTNYQPLLEHDNCSKGARYIG